MKIIKERTSVKMAEHYRLFDYGNGSGFRFPCDSNGKVDLSTWDESAIENYNYAMEHKEEFETWNEFNTNSWWYTENAQGKCSCGNIISLCGDTECENCGKWYNHLGQELLPPAYWNDDGRDIDF